MQNIIILDQDAQVVKMLILLLAKIVKLAWFDDPMVRDGIVIDVTTILLKDD